MLVVNLSAEAQLEKWLTPNLRLTSSPYLISPTLVRIMFSKAVSVACVNIPSCFSFNLAAFADIINGKILCELLPSDIYNNSKKLVASQFHHHYSIKVS